MALISVKAQCKISPALDHLPEPIRRGHVELYVRPSILMDIVGKFQPSVLHELGIEEDMHVLLFAYIYRRDAWDDLLWLLKRGTDYLFAEKSSVVHRDDVKTHVLSRIVQPKPLPAIIEAIKNDRIQDASEVGRLEKEAILVEVLDSEFDIIGTPHVIRVHGPHT